MDWLLPLGNYEILVLSSSSIDPPVVLLECSNLASYEMNYWKCKDGSSIILMIANPNGIRFSKFYIVSRLIRYNNFCK